MLVASTATWPDLAATWYTPVLSERERRSHPIQPSRSKRLHSQTDLCRQTVSVGYLRPSHRSPPEMKIFVIASLFCILLCCLTNLAPLSTSFLLGSDSKYSEWGVYAINSLHDVGATGVAGDARVSNGTLQRPTSTKQ
eukprot:3426436-Pyramimonas_sp.AAC.1